jgi:ATPase subunit of ABC transporter with duplicated ATPase domains
MVAIIGGRGTGKSLLLDALRSRFAGATAYGIEEREVNVEHLSIELDKTNGEKTLFDTRTDSYDYLHVSQGKSKPYASNPALSAMRSKKCFGWPTARLRTNSVEAG